MPSENAGEDQPTDSAEYPTHGTGDNELSPTDHTVPFSVSIDNYSFDSFIFDDRIVPGTCPDGDAHQNTVFMTGSLLGSDRRERRWSPPSPAADSADDSARTLSR